VSISPGDDTDSTKSDGEYDSEHDPDVDMGMEDNVDEPNGVDLHSDFDMDRDGDDDKEQDVEEEDKVEKEEEDEDEDDGKEPRTISHMEIVCTSADDLDTTVGDQRIILPEQGQEMREHTPRPHPPELALKPQRPAPRPQPQMPETPCRSGLEDSGLVTPQKPPPAVPSPRGAEAARITSEVDVDQQLLGDVAGGESLPDIPLPDVPLSDVPLPYAPLPEARLDGPVGEE